MGKGITTDKTPATLAIDVLAVLRRHAESHRASAGSDAYSAQEAPRLEYAITAVAELIEAAQAVENSCVRHDANDADLFRRLDAAIARVKGGSA